MLNEKTASHESATMAEGQEPTRSIVAEDWLPGQYTLRDCWFPIAHGPHVSKSPIRRVIHSMPYYLWRENGQVKAAEFHPSRLQASLSQAGELTGGSGYYPSLERYGYVWVWYGNPDHADEELIPDVPYLPKAGLKLPRNMWGQIYFSCAAELCTENLLDLVHADYLHAGFVGDEENESDQVIVESSSETITMIREVSGKRIPPVLRALGVPAERADYRAVAHVHIRSGVVVLHGKFSPGFSQPLFHPLIPESRDQCRANYSFNITDAPMVARNVFPLFAYGVGPQDDRMMREQNPRYMRTGEPRDVSSRFDAAASRYRMLSSKLIRRQQQGDYGYSSDANISADISGVLDCVRVN
jgi:hypothetical protein